MTQTNAPAVPAPSLFQCIIDWGRRELSGLEGEAATLWNTIEPKLVAEVSFAEWTRDGSLRHAAFIGLRDDKPPKEVTRDPTLTVFRDEPP